MGGTSLGTRWRDCGVSLIIALYLGYIAYLKGFLGLWVAVSLFPTFGLGWAALTTYRYFLPKPSDYKWYHYSLHGFMVALSATFFAWASGYWLGFGIRSIVCCGLVGFWSHIISKDTLEEWGRGFILVSSLPLLLI